MHCNLRAGLGGVIIVFASGALLSGPSSVRTLKQDLLKGPIWFAILSKVLKGFLHVLDRFRAQIGRISLLQELIREGFP